MKPPDGKEDNTPISTIISYSQMNKVTDCFLTTDWISQNITTNNFTVKHEEDLHLETALFFNAVCVLVLLKSREQKATDTIKQIL